MRFFDSIPEEVKLSHEEFLKFLGEPSIVKIQGKTDECVVISSLIHGNEPSGFFAMQNFLKQTRELDKTVFFVFFNIRASLTRPFFTTRHCDDESDLNRVWGDAIGSEGQKSLIEEMKNFFLEKKPQFYFEFHNTTGNNPVFVPTPTLDSDVLRVASVFSDLILHYPSKDTLIGWLESKCCSLAIECGKNALEQSHHNAEEVLKKALVLSGCIKGSLEYKDEMKILCRPDKISVDNQATIDISDENTGADLVLRKDIDELNLKEIPADFFLGFVNKNVIEHEKLYIMNNELRTKQPCMFLMLTAIPDVIRKDALGYFVDVNIHKI